jgi:hypothetical protein
METVLGELKLQLSLRPLFRIQFSAHSKTAPIFFVYRGVRF